MTPVLSVMARMKPLRGTPFNPFGYHGEARLHRNIRDWYDTLLDRAMAEATPETVDQWYERLAAADQIRGYGPVREEAFNRVNGTTPALTGAVVAPAE